MNKYERKQEVKKEIEKALDALNLPKDVRSECDYSVTIAEGYLKSHGTFIRVKVGSRWGRNRRERQTVSSKKNQPVDMNVLIPLIVEEARFEARATKAIERELGIEDSYSLNITGTSSEEGELEVSFKKTVSPEDARKIAKFLKQFIS